MNGETTLLTTLISRRGTFARVIPQPLDREVAVLDLTSQAHWLEGVDPGDVEAFSEAVNKELARHKAEVGIGRYDEDRVIYRHSSLFDGAGEPRTVHLGIDLFVAAGTLISVPLAGRIHSFANNSGTGDYGPTLIIEHRIDDLRFFTLYGHLSRASTSTWSTVRQLAAGDTVAQLGDIDENGGWPPHLHFQLISDIGNYRGDFPGVARAAERLDFLKLCPDPNLLLQIPALGALPKV